ncbi:hypothetical protein QE357_002564 [Siphonobacter sp. BAB-5404]|nr:hypothetical protein [Siphonobacter sp. SORGH_AS_0500]
MGIGSCDVHSLTRSFSFEMVETRLYRVWLGDGKNPATAGVLPVIYTQTVFGETPNMASR